jgi:hypothetical protein
VRAKSTTKEAAVAVDISRVTLQRWLRAAKIKNPPRPAVGKDGRAVRQWSAADIAALGKLKEEIYRQGQGHRSDKLGAKKKSGNR